MSPKRFSMDTTYPGITTYACIFMGRKRDESYTHPRARAPLPVYRAGDTVSQLLFNPRTNPEKFFRNSRKSPRHYSVEVTKYPLKCLIMLVESAIKDQNTLKLISFNMLVSNLLYHVCKRSYRAKSGVITQEFL